MAKKSSRRLRAVAIFVIFLSLAWAGYNVLKPQKTATSSQANYRDSDKLFTDYSWQNKAKIRVRSSSLKNATQEMDGLIRSYSLEKPLLKSSESSHGVYIFKIESSNLPTLKEKFHKVGSITVDKEVVDSSLVNKRLETEEAILASRRKNLEDIDAMGHVYGNLAKDKEELISQIRAQENLVDVLKRADTTLLYVELEQAVVTNTVAPVKVFVKQFFFAIIVLFVASVLAYYGTKLIMYLLALMGVKGFSAASLGGFQYGYGNYANRYYSRYGSGRSKRKVKRVYKDGRSKNDEDEGVSKQE